MSDKECLFRLNFFLFFLNNREPSTKHPKENSLNLEEDLEEGLHVFYKKNLYKKMSLKNPKTLKKS